MTTTTSAPADATHHGRLRRLAQRHPITAFVVLAFGVGWPMVFINTTTSWSPWATNKSVASYVALLGAALAVTWAAGGAQALRAFLARFLIWRFEPARWAIVLLAFPLLTVAVGVRHRHLRRAR